MTTYAAPSPPFIPAKHHGGSQTPRDIVMHSTVSPCREGQAKATAEFFARGVNVSSAHYSVDPGAVWQSVHDHIVAYHCGFNQDSIAVEMCEFPSAVNIARWFDKPHRQMRRRAARLVARLCLAYDIPPYYRGVKARLAGKHGVTTHAVMSQAFKRSTHWDPGVWPRRLFMRQVRRQIALLKEQS